MVRLAILESTSISPSIVAVQGSILQECSCGSSLQVCSMPELQYAAHLSFHSTLCSSSRSSMFGVLQVWSHDTPRYASRHAPPCLEYCMFGMDVLHVWSHVGGFYDFNHNHNLGKHLLEFCEMRSIGVLVDMIPLRSASGRWAWLSLW